MSPSEILLKHLTRLEPDAMFTKTSHCYKSSSGASYFAKVGSTSEREQYMGEAESLKAMNLAAPGLVPKLLDLGIDDDSGRPYFISEYKDLVPLSEKAAGVLGKRLATEMHQFKSPRVFGFNVPTFCGDTRLANGWFDTWEECFDNLMGGLLKTLKSHGGYEELVGKAEEVRSKLIPQLLGPLFIHPVLLHGDLWSGNTGMDRKTGDPVIYDPSSYYGHNESDLAIARLFGGIPKSFFTVYHEHFPKSEPKEDYELRGELYELFHCLNHTALYGQSYASQSMAKINTLMRSCKEDNVQMVYS